ncbi:MAG: bifunctional folylpolyglutamate synthase/dihydrofolate synthase [Clostridia bacterium]|nr:bifunctional folylpolyglutamate synthase/dihydrofolate synthase [Clostridia bacterium]
MNYTEAIEYIHSVNWTFCKPGLERVETLCHALGDPQDSLKFVHVAGTNGKGSFCAMTDSILRKAGYKVGLFTSPYIVEFNERMRINGENISNEELCELVEYIKPIADKMEDKPTEFELITSLAFLYFARHNCDVVVLECGLGGRLDATNIIRTPILSVITGIALDHTAILGDTIEKIAGEKAGIIKKDVPVLWCGKDESAKEVILSRAAEMGAPTLTVDRSSLKVKESSLSGTTFDYAGREELHLSLLGSYQPENATNCLTAIDSLKNMGFDIPEQAIREGLKTVKWPARFEIISHSPLIIADGGHNPEGIDGAVKSIESYFGENKVCIVTGVMADKDYKYMASRIASVAEKVFTLTPANPRALDATAYAKVFSSLGVSADACASVSDAVNNAIKWAKENNKPIISLGSLYMYCEVAEAVKNKIDQN